MAATDNVLVLFPGALGDFICVLQTVLALRRHYRGVLGVVAQSALLELIDIPDTRPIAMHRREIADLFASTPPAPATVALLGGFGHVHSWTGHADAHLRRRLADVTGGQVDVYPFRGMQTGEHAVDYYARCVGLSPESSMAAPLVSDDRWLAALRADRRLEDPVLVMHPGSGAPQKNWRGFSEVARAWNAQRRGTVIALQGPAEVERADTAIPDALVLRDLSLPQVAALLRAGEVYLGNDSGVSHLAGALGARGVVLFGPSDPATWAPRGRALEILHAPVACPDCGPSAFCCHRLPVPRVVAALESAQRRPRS